METHKSKMQPALQASMFDEPELVAELKQIISRHGYGIYPIRTGISKSTANYGLNNSLLLYVSGTNEIRYAGNICGFKFSPPEINDPRFPEFLKPYFHYYKASVLLDSIRKISPFSWRRLKNKDGAPLKSVSQGPLFKVQWVAQ